MKRMCYYIPVDSFVPGKGWRVSIVTENEAGHSPTGDDGNDPGRRVPWYWGFGGGAYDYAEVKKFCAQRNLESFGLTEADVSAIVTSSMGAQNKEARERKLEHWQSARKSGKE